MSSVFSRRCALRLSLAFAALAPTLAQAQEAFPTRAVRIVVPFPAGSALDGVTRLLADGLNAQWGGRGVVVENVAGAGGNLGTQQFARAAPDGHTLLAAPPGPFVLNSFLYKEVNYDPRKFVPISLLTTVPNVLVVRPGLDARTFTDFIEAAKRRPGKLNYASQGVGSSGYLTGRALEQRAGVSLVHVPYRGAAQILNDLAAGHIDSFFDTATTSLPMHRGGKTRIIAVADDARLEALPDVPTIAEYYPGFRSITWFALAAPEGTPAALADRISQDVAKVIASEKINRLLRDRQMTPRGTSGAETRRFLENERAAWGKLIDEIGFEKQ